MWPTFGEETEKAFATYEQGPHKIAGFFHEIIMMNPYRKTMEIEPQVRFTLPGPGALSRLTSRVSLLTFAVPATI